jgi:hypothetical protein
VLTAAAPEVVELKSIFVGNKSLADYAKDVQQRANEKEPTAEESAVPVVAAEEELPGPVRYLVNLCRSDERRIALQEAEEREEEEMKRVMERATLAVREAEQRLATEFECQEWRGTLERRRLSRLRQLSTETSPASASSSTEEEEEEEEEDESGEEEEEEEISSSGEEGVFPYESPDITSNDSCYSDDAVVFLNEPDCCEDN